MRAYPTHESGGIIWAYLGPRATMKPFRDFGTGELDGSEVMVTKQQWNGIDDIPDDGSDKPGYPSNAMSWKFWRHDRAPRLEVEDTWYGYHYAGMRTTPNGNTHVRVTAYALPYSTMVASIPFSVGHGMFVPVDDEYCWRYFSAPKTGRNPRNYGGPNLFALVPFSTPVTNPRDGIIPPPVHHGNDFQIDRDTQRNGIFSGVCDFVSQDLMVTESMGPVYDRSQEHLGSTDRAITRMRRILLSAARGLAAGREPPAVTGGFRAIRGAEKILEPGEDWRVLGTEDGPAVQETNTAATGEQLTD